MARRERTVPLTYFGPLCDSCSLIDFLEILHLSTKGSFGPVRTLAQVKRTPTCPFCALLTRCAEEPFGPLSPAEADKTAFALYTELLRPERVLAADETVPPYLLFVVQVHHQCPDDPTSATSSPCSKDTCARNEHRRVWEPLYLDRMGEPAVESDPGARCVMVRYPMESRFEPEKLLSWIAEDHYNEARDPDPLPRTQAGIASLKSLVKQSKFRVIDVTSNTVVTMEDPIAILQTGEYIPDRYVALSYVWGDSMAAHLSASRAKTQSGSSGWSATLGASGLDAISWITEWLPDILSWKDTGPAPPVQLDLADLPQTIRDSIALTRAINIRYLWVDSLCINQSDARDKAHIVSQMGPIYANAYLTIVAADGSDANAGLGRLHDPAGALEETTAFVKKDRLFVLTPLKPNLEEALAETTWRTRGWTFQERYLSKRCVFFTPHQVYYQSTHVKGNEAYALCHQDPVPGAPVVYFKTDEKNDIRDKFHQMGRANPFTFDFYDYAWAVRNFSELKLSHRGDRLDAFLGLSQRLQHIAPSDFMQRMGRTEERSLALEGLPERTYIQAMTIHAHVDRPDRLHALAGLPEPMFANALCWLPRTDDAAATTERIELDTSGMRHLPSWSWAGWTGPIEYPMIYGKVSVAAVLDAANIICKIESGAPRGAGAWIEPCKVTKPIHVTLHLRAPSTVCRLVRIEQESARYVYSVEIQAIEDRLPSVQLSAKLILSGEVDEAADFHLVGIGHPDDSVPEDRSCYWFMLLRTVGQFYERVGGMVQDRRDLDVRLEPYMVRKYFKVR